MGTYYIFGHFVYCLGSLDTGISSSERSVERKSKWINAEPHSNGIRLNYSKNANDKKRKNINGNERNDCKLLQRIRRNERKWNRKSNKRKMRSAIKSNFLNNIRVTMSWEMIHMNRLKCRQYRNS